MRILNSLAAVLLLLSIPLIGYSQEDADETGPKIVVADFESGIGSWTTNDDQAEESGRVTKAAIYAVSGGAPQAGAQSARMEFTRSMSGWASISLPVNGLEWATKGCSTVSFWLRGDGSGQPLRIVLRVQKDNPKTDVAYSQVIKVESTQWERYSLRWFGFKDPDNNVLPLADIQYVKLLQFAKNGGWSTFRFRVDQITVEAEKEAPVPEPVPVTQFTGKTLEYEPDFSKQGPYSLAQIGLTMGRPPTIIDSKDEKTAAWAYALVSDLGPCVVRLKLDGYYDADKETYDLDLLVEHIAWVRKCNSKPLVCVDMPDVPPGDLEARKRLFGVFVRAVRDLAERTAQSPQPIYYEIFDEPLLSGVFDDMAHVCAAYDSIAKLILTAHPAAKIGGPGLASGWDEHLAEFVKTVTRLDFLSFHFYGAHNSITASDALFEAAHKTKPSDLPHQLNFQSIKRLVKQHRKIPPDIFVTEFAPNSAVDDRGDARDDRANTAFGAAWLAAAVLTGGPYVDKVLLYQMRPGGWGTVCVSGAPETPYWGAWLMRSYAPRGCVRQSVSLLDDMTVVALTRTRSAHNVIIAHAGPEALELRISPKNAPKLEAVRYRKIENADLQWRGGALDPEADQTMLLEGAGVTVIQYIPASEE